jgi:hypothetical protein
MKEQIRKEAEDLLNDLDRNYSLPRVYFGFQRSLKDYAQKTESDREFDEAFCQLAEEKYNLRQPTTEEISKANELEHEMIKTAIESGDIVSGYRNAMEGQSSWRIQMYAEQDTRYQKYQRDCEDLLSEICEMFWKLVKENDDPAQQLKGGDTK